MKNIFSFSLVILTLIAGTGCTQPKGDETRLVTPRGGNGGGGVDPNNPSKPSDQKIVATDKFVIRSVHSQRLSHEIFTELWMHIWEDRMSRPNTVFMDVSQMIEAHRDFRSGHFNEINNQCPERLTNLKLDFKAETSEITGFALQSGDCATPKNPKWQTMVSATVLAKDKVQWDMYGQYFPRGLGKHLSAEKIRVRCDFNHLDDKRIKELHCVDIGQSRDADTYMRFSKMDYNREGDILVSAEGKKFKNGVEACEDPKFCTIIKVPNEGAIMILEKVGTGKASQQPAGAPEVGTAAGIAGSATNGAPAWSGDPELLNALGQVIKPADPVVDQQF